MSDAIPALPSPEDYAGNEAPVDERTKADRGSRPRPVRSVEDCLRALDQLPGMVAMGLLRPAQANAIRGVLRDMIQFQQRAAGNSAANMPLSDDLLQRLRKEPELMNLMV